MSIRHWIAVVWISLVGFPALDFDGRLSEAASDSGFTHDAYVLPAGTRIPALLQEEISTETAFPGQALRAVVAREIFVGTQAVLTRTTQLHGHVIESRPPVQGRNALLKIRFEGLTLDNGMSLPLVADVQTGSDRHDWGGELTPGTKPEIVPYNIHRIGTYGRVMYRGPRSMGEHVKIQTGTWMVLILQEPVTIRYSKPETSTSPKKKESTEQKSQPL